MKPMLFATATTAALLLAGLATPAQAMIAAQISSGGDTTCAIVDNGHVACWGSNRYSTLGFGISGSNLPRPGLVMDGTGNPLRNMVQVSVSPGRPGAMADSGGHACALSTRGEVWCWGRRDGGRLGVTTGGNENLWFAERVRFDNGTVMNEVVQVAAGGAHTCALRESGRVHCWGINRIDDTAFGLLGMGETGAPPDTRPNPLPTGVVRVTSGPLEQVVEIALGRRHGCARRWDNTVWCWGNNDYGQIGLGTYANGSVGRATQVRKSSTVTLDNATALAVGADHSCVIGSDRHVYCWGNNLFGQSGYRDTGGNTPEISPFARVVFGPGGGSLFGNVRAIAAGSNHTCVRSGAGSVQGSDVHCWGLNNSGQIGAEVDIGSWSVRPSRVTQVLPGEPGDVSVNNIEQLAAGYRHSCVLHQIRRDIRCWGRNDQGQRGLNSVSQPNESFHTPRREEIVLGMNGHELDAIFHDNFGWAGDMESL